MDKRPRLERLATVGSQLLNVLIFDGSPDETVSGRSWREGMILGNPKWARRREWIDWLFGLFGDKHHCLKSHLIDLQFARAIIALHP